MANSPTLCQSFVALAIQPVRDTWKEIYIIHYMDDILLAGRVGQDVFSCFKALQTSLTQHGLLIAPEKVQLTDPYTYLGFQLKGSQITTQKVQLRLDKLKTFNDFQKLLGDINWLLPHLKLCKADLKPLYDILNGDPNPTSPRELTSEGIQAIQTVDMPLIAKPSPSWTIASHFNSSFARLLYLPPLCSGRLLHSCGYAFLICQKGVLEPYYLMVASLIIQGRTMGKEYFGQEPSLIVQLYSKEQVQWLMQITEAWPVALASFSGQLDNHYPPHKLITFASRHEFVFPKITKLEPIPDGLVVFTDGSSTGIAAYVTQGHTVQFQTQSSSAQLTELQAVAAVFSAFPNQSLNVYTDSAYIAQSIPNLETAPIIKHTSSAAKLFKQLQQSIISRTHPFFIGHFRAHSGLPGPLSQGNQQADLATRSLHTYAIETETPLSQAQHTHSLHHLNAHSLRLLHHITREQARQIVKECTQCATHLPVPHLGVNPRGLVPNALWQMDVTHIPEFGNLKYVHVCVDTCSGYVFATLQTGEATKQVIGHLLSAFATLGCPQKIKTDNGPGYTSSAFARFCSKLNI
uniref:Uncharacterized protein n=1 Tax=Callithrix jacchus TaxID=9483 RepID=A0A8I3ZZR8_CALJA